MSLRINHIGITVGDIEAAVDFYTGVFGLKVLVAPGLHGLETGNADRRRDVFGPRWGGMKLAHLADETGAGFELFEFVTPPSKPAADPFEYERQGISHLCVTVAGLDAVLLRLVAAGGQQRSAIHQVSPTTRVVYCQDPWGVIIELASDSYHGLLGLPS